MTMIEELRQALESAPKFSAATWVEQLQDRARNVSDLSFLKNDLTELAQEKVLNGDHLNSGGATTLIDKLAQATTAHAVASLSGDDDPYNFRGCADQTISKLNMTDTLTRLMGYCYADHLDAHITAKGLPKLAVLQQDASFVSEYKNMFLNIDTVVEQIEHDLTVGTLSYSASLLFVANYFEHEATPLLHEHSKIWVQAFGKIAQAKIAAAVGDKGFVQTDKFPALVSLVSQALTIAYGQAVEGFLRPPYSGEILQPLAGMDVPEDVKKRIEQLKLENLQLGDWKAYGEVMVSLWDDVAAKYNGAVRTQAKVETAHYEPQVIFDPMVGPPPPVITTTTGQGVKDWLNRGRSNQSTFVTKDPGVNWKISIASPFGSCFVAGTEIITRTGPKKIEDLAEHDWVLTRGEFDEWGKVSDERVQVPVEDPIIHGFNDENPFFTAGHVFFTTTGLRALDPTLAMKENPWADVGRLAVGHVVLRLDSDDEQYQQVLIKSISSERMPDVRYVYGVHLREGRRSYHANRYLVAVNYPELTMKSICKMLRTIPVPEQARMLFAFDELRPLFERFGIGGISDMLRVEVEAESDKNSMRLYKVARNKLTGPGHGSLQYPPEEINGVNYSKLLAPLPNVSVLEGVVYVDGQVCQRASIDNIKNQIRWVRSVNQPSDTADIFEHGNLIVDPLTLAAQGAILYSTDAEAEKALDIGFIQYLAMGCQLDGPPTYQEAMLVASAPVYSMARLAQAVPARAEVAAEEPSEERTLEEAAFEEAPAARVSAMQSRAPRVTLMTAEAEETDIDPLFAPGDETLPFMNPLRFNMIFDANRYKKDQVNPGDPVTFGSLDLAVGRKRADGLSTRVAILPDLDKLRDLIQAKLVDPTIGKLASFYVSTLSIDDQQRTKVSIAMTPNAQELLRGYKDKASADEDFSFGWTFKETLDTDVSLGMMFSSLELTLGPDQKTATGSIVEYSSDSETGEGPKHLLLSNPGDTAKRVEIEKRTDASSTAGGVPTGSPTTPISTPQKPVPPPRQGPKGPYHVATLEAIPYNNEDLEKKSKSVLESIMYFHMETGDLNEILNKKQPDDLPPHLAKNLPGNLRDWIRNVYSPAYTALTIAESYNTKDWVSKFKPQERAKILYFWQGDGPRCLSSSPEYKILNQLAVREAMLRLYSVLDQFVTDDGPTWAKTYYEEVKANKLYDAAEQVVVGNQQPLQKYCNILYVLDADGQYAKEFYEDVVDISASSLAIQQTSLSGDSAPWLPHATKALADALLNPNDKTIPDEVRKSFMKDFEQFCKEQNIEFDRENKEKLANALISQLNLATNMPKALGAATLFAKGLFYRSSTVVKQGAWLKSNDMSKSGGKLGTAIKMLALFANVANLIFNKDADLTDSEKARVGGTIAKNVMDILGPHFIKTGPRSAAQIHAETAILNDKARKTPFGWRRGKLVEEKVKYMEKLGEEALEGNANAARSGGLLSRLKNKISVPPKVMRMIGIAIAVAFIGFLIWDLVAHGGAMSGGQLALGIINIVLEAAIVIVEVLGLLLPASTLIPVIGQILAIAVIVVGVLVMIFGNTEHQKTPGEKFVERMQTSGGWLSRIDEPPSPLLSATISSSSGNKNSTATFTVTLTNDTGKTISFIDAAPSAPGQTPSTDTINSVELSFFSGSDDTNLFSNAAFAGPGEARPNGSGTWSITTPGAGGSKAWDVAMQKPNGTSLRSTNFNLRVKGITGQTAKIDLGSKMEFSISGTLGTTAGTTMIKVIEKRPGAPFAPATFEITRN
ncbi:hypothetical protein BFJ71_g16606 [Fusarium oxysporum]|nr:hypothetical protein BFJ71_g16606 [Fusarium oxysporum]